MAAEAGDADSPSAVTMAAPITAATTRERFPWKFMCYPLCLCLHLVTQVGMQGVL
jgi:hypothetical protein